MSNIREASPDDLEALTGIGAAFHAKTPIPLDYDGEKMAQFIAAIIASPDGVVFMNDSGGTLGAMLAPVPYSHETQAVEMWWWATGKGAMALLDAFEAWAADRGASCAALTTFSPYERLMARRGYGLPQYTRYKAI